MKSFKPLILLFGSMAVIAACTTGGPPSSSGKLEAPGGVPAIALAPGEKVAVISATQENIGMDELLDCVGSVMRKANPALGIVPDKRFRAELFPWFEPGTAPDSDEALAALLQQPVVNERITSLGVRYVVSVGGSHTKSADDVGGAAGVIVLGGEDQSQLSARLWDLQLAKSMGSITASASGHFAAGVIAIVPFAFGPDTKGKVCNDVGWRLAQFLSGGKLAEPQTNTPTPQTPRSD